MHGLPYQTTETMKRSAEYALLLKPDRIALFGYAHVPWIKKHMRLMPEEELPDAGARFDLFECAKAVFVKNDYAPVGIDHFTKPNDSLAKAMRNKTLRRNFQGYTDDNADALIGFGASAITKFPSGFSQNALQIHNYRDHILSDKLPVEKYCLLSAEDKLREEIIQSLMCALSVDTRAICAKHGYEHDLLNRAFRELQPLKISGLIKIRLFGRFSG